LFQWETRFCHYRLDFESGLYQARNRYYHSKLGRWLSRDPIQEAGAFNLYLAFSNSPISTIDPLGLRPLPIVDELVESDRDRKEKELRDKSCGCHIEGDADLDFIDFDMTSFEITAILPNLWQLSLLSVYWKATFSYISATVSVECKQVCTKIKDPDHDWTLETSETTVAKLTFTASAGPLTLDMPPIAVVAPQGGWYTAARMAILATRYGPQVYAAARASLKIDEMVNKACSRYE
jgi:RHS repeat-associated protein